MNQPPNVLENLREDVADWRRWVARSVVLGFAVLAGLSVVCLTWLSEKALHFFHLWHTDWRWAPLLVTPLATAGIVWLTRRYAPGTAGSGIPQVIAALDPATTDAERSKLVSLRLSLAKIGLTASGLLAGLPIGREGPSVQIAAGVMHHAKRWLPEKTTVSSHGLLVAGGAAGIAAAFNTPLGGIMFAIEELSRRIEQRNSGLIISAIVVAGLMAVSVFGNSSYFGVIRVGELGVSFLLPAALVILGCGVLGGLFSRLLHASLIGGTDRFSRWRRAYPVRFAGACGLGIAVIGLVSGGAAFGSGYESTSRLLHGPAELPLLYVTLRFIATWLAIWSGVPGGLFAPSLALGAGIGADVALLTGGDMPTAALIAMGMAGFLAAVTQAPLTAFIIVMEMVEGHAMVLTLMTAALGASLISRWISQPLYSVLAAAQIPRREVPAAAPPAPSTAPLPEPPPR